MKTSFKNYKNFRIYNPNASRTFNTKQGNLNIKGGYLSVSDGVVLGKGKKDDMDRENMLWINEDDSELYFGDKVVSKCCDMDNWIKRYLIDKPPSLDLTEAVDTKIIYVYWEYPEQITVGFLNQGLPYVKSLHCEYSINNSTVKKDLFHLRDNESDDFVKRHEASSEETITGIIFIRNTSVTINNTVMNSNEIHDFTFDDGVSRRCYVFYDEEVSLLTNDDTLFINIYYKNYSGNVDNHITLSGFLQVGKPSKPLTVQAQHVTPPVFDKMFVTYNPPSITDDFNDSSYIQIKDYKINYLLVGNSVRYGGLTGLAPQNNNIVDSDFQETVIGLYPDSQYRVTVQARNIMNSNYGELSDPAYYTSVHIPPKNFNFNLVFISQYLNPIQAKKVYDDILVSNLILYDTVECPSYDITTSIHNEQNRGSASSQLLKIESTLSTNNIQIAGPVLFFNGFPSTLPSPQTSNYMTLTPTNIRDSYVNEENYKQGYYLQGTFKFSFYKNILQSSRFLNTFQLKYNNNTSTSYNFYYDSTSTSPTIEELLIEIKTASVAFVSGIQVIYGVNTLQLHSKNVRGLGQYFYNKDKIIKYTSEIYSGETLPSGTLINNTDVETNLNNIPYEDKDNGDLSAVVNVVNQQVKYNVTRFFNRIYLSTQAFSVNGNSSLKKYKELLVMQDPYSVNLIQNVLPGSIQSLSTVHKTGYRVWTGNSNVVTKVPPLTYNNVYYKDIPYNHQWNITSEMYREELQIADGKFTTRADSKAYRNYNDVYNSINYSLNDTNSYRFATFVWYVSDPGSENFNYLNLELVDATSPFIDPLYKTVYANSSSSSKLMIHYRFEDINDDNLDVLNENNYSSFWINGNGNDTNQPFVDEANRINVDIDPYYGFIDSEYNPTTSTLSFKLQVPYYIQSSFHNRLAVYVRIGLPQSIIYSFSSARCYFSS